MKEEGINIDKGKIADFCRKNHITRLALFGSILRDDFKPESDVDILVELEPGHKIGFMGMASMEIELSEMVGRKVDLRTPSELSDYFRNEVLSKAEVQYEG
jgi:predicted nucleotidyltransferase